MKRDLSRVLTVVTLLVCFSSPSFAARQYDPEIKEYMKKRKEERKEEAKKEEAAKKADPNRRLRPYQTYDEINAELDKLLIEHADIFTGGTYGKSAEGRDLRWIRLDTGAPGDKPEILVTANIHAQELAGGQMAMELIRYFAEGYGVSCDATRTADAAIIYFLPLLNPDEMERAAAMQSKYGFTTFIRKNVNKVDLNRNFPYPKDAPGRLKDEAGSPKQRATSYRGEYPLSEPETASLIRFIDQHNFILALNYHTSGGLILYGQGTYPDPPPDSDLMKSMAESYQAKQFDKYSVQPGIDLYPTMGALDEYLYHRYGILSFTVEVGKGMETRAFDMHEGTLSPVFWAYNVYELEREAANNVPGAIALFDYAVVVHKTPSLRKWQPEEELWVGEPPRPEK